MNRRKWVFTLLAFLLVSGILVGGRFPYLLLFITATLVIYSFYSTKNTQRRLVVIFWSNTYQAEKGDTIHLEYKIYNSGFLPLPYLEIKDSLSKRLSNSGKKATLFALLPYETIQLDMDVECEHRGYYQIGELQAVTGDIFGLRKKEFTLKDDILLTVYPKIYKLDYFDITGKEFFGSASTNQKQYEDYSSIKDIRKYEIGDSLKKVSWKVTAKKMSFMLEIMIFHQMSRFSFLWTFS